MAKRATNTNAAPIAAAMDFDGETAGGLLRYKVPQKAGEARPSLVGSIYVTPGADGFPESGKHPAAIRCLVEWGPKAEPATE